ncbi:hypothetical protein ACFFSH_38020 [Streptomyces filamentosus]|uniref:Uncharacterized protein n=1 Tax=Streptomyces filamentosus TaxID=67294 RepID=A0A919BQU5_STRFL|nr:hypothetical protein [Streptomyces filamentosus]GHG04263.1 hypothetical protein GCM10017667_38410 [Streptomyces filamentosus]
MTRPHPSHARPLLLGLALLLAGTAVLLHSGTTAPRPGSARAGAPSAAAHPAPPAAPASRPAPHADGQSTATPRDRPTQTGPAGSPAADLDQVPGDQPVSGDGPAGDYAIQQLLDRTTPTDLPPATARRLTELATRIWTAETTGTGRTQWPGYFTPDPLRAPYHDVRVQAAVAHQHGRSAGCAEVRLVWAGADAAGEFRDGRTARVLLELHHNEWRPIR